MAAKMKLLNLLKINSFFTAFRIETTIVSVSQFEFAFLSIQYG